MATDLHIDNMTQDIQNPKMEAKTKNKTAARERHSASHNLLEGLRGRFKRLMFKANVQGTRPIPLVG